MRRTLSCASLSLALAACSSPPSGEASLQAAVSADTAALTCPSPSSTEAANAWLKTILKYVGDEPFGDSELDMDRAWIHRAPVAEDIPFLMALPTVKTLMLRFAKYDGAFLEGLGCLPRLEELQFQGNHFVSDDLAALARGFERTGANLRAITLVDETVGDDGPAALAAIPTLETIAMKNLGIQGGTWLAAFQGHPSLTRIDWDSADLDVLDAENLGALRDTKLQGLGLSGFKLTDQDIAALSGVQSLTRLSLPRNDLHGCIAPLAATPLLSLSLSGNPLAPECVSEIGKVSSIKTLVLLATPLVLDDLRGLVTELPALSKIRIDEAEEAAQAFVATAPGRDPALCVEDYFGSFLVCTAPK